MKPFKTVIKGIGLVLLLPILYLIISLILTYIPVNTETVEDPYKDTVIYLSTNGVHLEIIMLRSKMHQELFKGLVGETTDQYFSFGWGEENFYLNTPNWSDLTFKNAFKAAFLESSTLIHVSRYKDIKAHWIKIPINDTELQQLNTYLKKAFLLDKDDNKIHLADKGYSENDDFYRAKGNYSFAKTCNSWVNSAFKESGVRACYWTPFDFGLIDKHD